MSKRWRRILLVVVGVPVALFLLLMLDPFFRQLAFGPAPGGVPFVAWQRAFHEWELDEKPKPSGLWRTIQDAIVPPPRELDWRRLPAESRRAILLDLHDDREEAVRRQVAIYLGELPADEDVLWVLHRYHSRDSSELVRHFALGSILKVAPPSVEGETEKE